VTTAGEWLVNGDPGAGITPQDRGLAYGDGLFETIAWRAGAPRFLALHRERLAAGCARLALPEPPFALVEAEMARLAAGAARGTAKVVITRGPGPRGYAPPAAPAPTRLVGFFRDPEPAPRRPARLVTCATIAATTSTLAGLKTLNRLDSVLGRAECVAAGADEGLLLDDAGLLIGGTMSNVFLVAAGGLRTPRLDRGGVRGIMRSIVLEEARGLGLAATECAIGREQLERAEAVFVTNALVGLWPAGSLDGRALADSHERVAALACRLAERGVGMQG